MHVISKRTLQKHWERYPETEEWLTQWLRLARAAEWRTPQDVQATFAKVRLIPNNRAIFNVLNNQHRLVVKIEYRFKQVYIRFIGTHAEYGRIDATEI